MSEKWGVNNFEQIVRYDNSWIKEFSDSTWEEVESEINKLMIKRLDFFLKKCSLKERKILSFFWKSVWMFNKEWLHTEGEDLKNDEITFWKIVNEYHKNYNWFKLDLQLMKDYGYVNSLNLLREYDFIIDKIKRLIILYINLKINSKLSFDKWILDNLWFQKCSECFN